MTHRTKRLSGLVGREILVFVIVVQLSLVFLSQLSDIATVDEIFSPILANSPYHNAFLDAWYQEIPTRNGWMSAHILKENYAVEEYDRFNYAAVYYHQRMDVHPPLYYFLLHTISSMFPGTYSAQYALGINLASLCLIDIIMVKLCGLLYGKKEYAVVPLAFLTLMEIMQFLYAWQRMYMLLFLFCLWYVYIHARLFKSGAWKKSFLVQMICCIALGSLTHYYFYIYACLWSLGSTICLIRSRKKYECFHYLYAGVAGLAVSWIAYPYVMWHIFSTKTHTVIEPWTLEKGKEYLGFLNDRLFNGRVVAAGVIVLLLFVLRGGAEKQAIKPTAGYGTV